MGNTSSLTVNFSKSSVSPSLTLDSDYNTEIYEEEKSTFEPGDEVYLKLFYDTDDEYSIETSYGNCRTSSRNISYSVADTIAFAYSSSEQVSYIPEGTIDTEWIGNNRGMHYQVDRSINISDEEKVVGVLKCEYDTIGDRLHLYDTDISGENDYNIVVVAIFDNGNKASCTVSFQRTEGVEVDLEIVVKDVCTDDVIPNAEVSIPELIAGTTNENGVLSVGTVLSGTEYALSITADGYQDTATDNLNNDSFTVPTPED
jgi:hypothetical protein